MCDTVLGSEQRKSHSLQQRKIRRSEEDGGDHVCTKARDSHLLSLY